MTDVTRDGAGEPGGLSAADEQLLRELTERARAGGLKLTGEGGLLGRLTKMVVEGALEGEMDDHRPPEYWLSQFRRVTSSVTPAVAMTAVIRGLRRRLLRGTQSRYQICRSCASVQLSILPVHRLQQSGSSKNFKQVAGRDTRLAVPRTR
jgi:hypothetical protein